ncbi:hypothetical protein JOF28_002605 [Leucobacter exalbidus]|uniref:Uncharacterized protein n=1 Tax=Leucobacter exalbidus TaxID=662960 RepID=A0A940PV30_9MICO|nr:hypothetical protein [Leucobacter exalbidus]MBP1327373.1 hypothetical protein [Leucobacter exalbidus]
MSAREAEASVLRGTASMGRVLTSVPQILRKIAGQSSTCAPLMMCKLLISDLFIGLVRATATATAKALAEALTRAAQALNEAHRNTTIEPRDI